MEPITRREMIEVIEDHIECLEYTDTHDNPNLHRMLEVLKVISLKLRMEEPHVHPQG